MRIMFRGMLLAATAAISAPLLAQQPGASAAATVPPPLVDHHQHFLSPEGAAMLNAVEPPANPVPTDITALLSARAEAWDNAERLARLYTENAVAGDTFESAFHAGRADVAAFQSTLFAGPFRLTPTGFLQSGDVAHVQGYYSRGEGMEQRNFGRFLIELARRGGRWLIARESGVFPGPAVDAPITAAGLIEQLDEAGIRRAVILSIAYWFDAPDRPDTPENYAIVRAQNDWTAAQAAEFPDRLIAFCSFNPTRDHAVAEIERCAAHGGFRGVKLHMANSNVELLNPEHQRRLRAVFEAANRARQPIVIHTRDEGEYGRADVEAFLAHVLPGAPDIVVQIAHLWGGAGYSEDALAAFADAVGAGGAATRNLYFDVTDIALAARDEQTRAAIVGHMRRIGMDRIFYGSDAAIEGHPAAAGSWTAFRDGLPLTQEEYRTIATNVAPYLRD